MGEGRGEGKTAAPLSDDRSVITDNRLKTYNGTTYYYDDLGNLIHRELADGEVQNYFYDLHDQLVKAEIFKKDGTKETWAYCYDALGRRIGKGRLKNEEVSDGLEEETGFVWDGSHLLQEVKPDGRYTYIYTDPDSYEPLAQVQNWTTEDGESKQEINYFHCDQIGIPREMTDSEGNLVWFGDYYGWGKLKSETNTSGTAHQPFRLQNQYADRETGLHYNFFRYYAPECGRFVSQDPIGLAGGSNLYAFAPNAMGWFDLLGLEPLEVSKSLKQYGIQIASTRNPTSYDILNNVHNDMIKFNLKDTDQFFHCTAFCRVSKSSSPDKDQALKWGKRKEKWDAIKNFFGLYGSRRLSPEEMAKDSAGDLAVNDYGFKCPSTQTCAQRCEKFLNPKHIKTKEFLKGKGYL